MSASNDSPQGGIHAVARERRRVTGRPTRSLALTALVAISLLGGCASPRETSPAPPAVAAPRAMLLPPPARDATAADLTRPIPVCAIWRGELLTLTARYDAATGDTLLAGKRFAEVFPLTDEYAEGRPFPEIGDRFDYRGECYLRFGVAWPVEDPRRLRRVGEHRGLGIYADADAAASDRPETLYLSARPGCTFLEHHYELVGNKQPCGSVRW